MVQLKSNISKDKMQSKVAGKRKKVNKIITEYIRHWTVNRRSPMCCDVWCLAQNKWWANAMIYHRFDAV